MAELLESGVSGVASDDGFELQNRKVTRRAVPWLATVFLSSTATAT